VWEVFYYNSVDDSLTSHLVVRTAATNRYTTVTRSSSAVTRSVYITFYGLPTTMASPVFYYNSVDDSLTSHLVVRTAVTNR
jgi:hypothetical protein